MRVFSLKHTYESYVSVVKLDLKTSPDTIKCSCVYAFVRGVHGGLS